MKPQKGMLDKAPETCEIEEKILNEFKELCSLFAIKQVKTPIIEARSLFERSLGETSDVVSKEMFKVGSGNRFKESFDKLVLRPEGTVSVIRQFLNSKSPYSQRFYYVGSMFRKENPQKGRFREFTQGGIEFIKTSEIDVIEGLLCASKLLKNLNIKTKLKINYLGSFSTQNNVKKYLQENLDAEKLSDDSKTRIEKNPLRILDSKNSEDQDYLKSLKFDYQNFLTDVEKESLSKICTLLDQEGVNYDLDSSLVRGLDYYNNLVFEFQSDDLGSQSAVLAGGEYSNLLGLKDPCFGWAFGLERLSLLSSPPISLNSCLIFLPKEKENQISLLNKIRSNNISIKPLFKKNLQKSLELANKQGFDFALIVGENELNNNNLTIKNMKTGNQKTLKIEEIKGFMEEKGDSTSI